MYQIENTSAAIKELQRLLRINQSSNYDLPTKNAVLKIQSKYGLEQTGITDYETFTSILDDFQKYKSQIFDSEYLFNPSFPYVEGNMGINAERINTALALVLKNFSYEGVIPSGKYISSHSISATQYLQKIFNYDKTEKIDEAFMNRLLIELKAIEIKEKFR